MLHREAVKLLTMAATCDDDAERERLLFEGFLAHVEASRAELLADAPESAHEMAMRHVAQGDLNVRLQRDVIERLRRLGAQTELAEALLSVFEDTLAVHVKVLAMIETELARSLRSDGR